MKSNLYAFSCADILLYLLIAKVHYLPIRILAWLASIHMYKLPWSCAALAIKPPKSKTKQVLMGERKAGVTVTILSSFTTNIEKKNGSRSFVAYEVLWCALYSAAFLIDRLKSLCLVTRYLYTPAVQGGVMTTGWQSEKETRSWQVYITHCYGKKSLIYQTSKSLY